MRQNPLQIAVIVEVAIWRRETSFLLLASNAITGKNSIITKNAVSPCHTAKAMKGKAM